MKYLFPAIVPVFFSFLFSSIALANSGPAPTHLAFKNGAIQADCLWTQGPQTQDESVLEIDWKDGRSLTAIDLPGSLSVTLVMPSMPEMQNPPTQINRIIDPQGNPITGEFQVRNIYFTMGGDWLLNVTLKYRDGTEETQIVNVHLET